MPTDSRPPPRDADPACVPWLAGLVAPLKNAWDRVKDEEYAGGITYAGQAEELANLLFLRGPQCFVLQVQLLFRETFESNVRSLVDEDNQHERQRIILSGEGSTAERLKRALQIGASREYWLKRTLGTASDVNSHPSDREPS